LRVLRRYPVGAIRAALSPDGRTLLAGAGDGSVRFLDLVSGAVRMGAGRHDGAVVRAAFSADGRTAVTAGEDNRLLVWDARRAAVTETLSGHAGRITGLAISPDGRTLYTGALDGRVLVWDLAGDRRLARAFATGRGDAVPVPQGAPSWPLLHRPPLSYALRHDGRVLATGEGDGTVTLTDPRTLRRVGRLRAVPHGPVRGLGYVPHTPFLVAGGDAGYLAELDPGSGKLVRLLPGQRGTMLAPSFSADGRVMATVGAGDSVRLWRMRAGRPAGPPRTYIQPQETAGPAGAAVSPDGRRVAIASALGVEIVDVATLRRLRWLPNAGTIKALVGFTPDGRLLVGGSTGGWVRLWSTRTWRPASRVLSGGTEEVVAQSVSPDGHTLATGSPDGTVRLYDLRSSQPLGRPLPALPGHPAAPVFTPDGAFLLEISDAGRAYRWNVRPSAWGARACAIAGRTLSRAEWAQLLPEHPYTPACETPRLHR
jgi:WD40 repeat protein